MAKQVYIPGTKIPSLSKRLLGRDLQESDFRARTADTLAAQKKINSMTMGAFAQLFGGDRTKMNTALATAGIREAILKGLGDAVAYLRYDMDMTEPLIPVDTGALRASWFSEPENTETTLGVRAGFGGGKVNYAIFVHEMTDEAYKKQIQWSRPGSGAKFLEKALQRNEKKIVEIIIQNVKMVTT